MNRNNNNQLALVSSVLVAFALPAAPAFAQKAPSQRDRQLNAQLADAEARARVLQERLDQLERRLEQLNRTASTSAPTPPGAASSPARTVQTATPPPLPQTAQRSSPPRLGSFEVDEDAAQRALERTLTQSGALLLPRGSMSLTPSITYQRTERDSPVVVDLVNPATGATSPAIANQSLRRNEFVARGEFRAGLPMESQFELSVPLQHVRASRRDALGDVSDANGSGIGDITVGLAKTFMREKGPLPDLIGRVSLNTGTGKRTDGQVSLGSGYRQLTGELVALKRQDPLAFFASASYGHVFERDGIKPGAVTGLSIGTVLAASPATSLQFGFSQVHRRRQEINGAPVPGSDETYGLVNIGASSVLSRDMMLIVSAGIGVGSDAPKYSFNVALPITF